MFGEDALGTYFLWIAFTRDTTDSIYGRGYKQIEACRMWISFKDIHNTYK